MDARPKLNVTFNLLPMNERNSVIGKRMKFNVQDFFSKHEQNSGFVHIYKLFYKHTFISNARLKFAENQTNVKQHPETNFCYLKIIQILHSRYHLK